MSPPPVDQVTECWPWDVWHKSLPTCPSRDTNQAYKTGHLKPSLASHTPPHHTAIQRCSSSVRCERPFSSVELSYGSNELQLRDLPAFRDLRAGAVLARSRASSQIRLRAAFIHRKASGPGSGRLITSATSRRLATTTRATCTLNKGRDGDVRPARKVDIDGPCRVVRHLCVRVSFGSSKNPLDFGVLGLLAIEHLQPTRGRTAAYDALITSASSSTRACSPSSEHHPPTHLVATMPQQTRL